LADRARAAPPAPTDTRERSGGIVDVQGYVAPAMELVYENGTPEFRGVWPKIEERLVLTQPLRGCGDWESPYLLLPPEAIRVGEADRWLTARRAASSHADMGQDLPSGILHDNPGGRLAAMDHAGVASQLLSPGPSIDACRDLPSNIAAGVLGAYNRYLLDYCGAAPHRLRAVIQVHGGEAPWSAREIRDLADEPAVAAVSVCLPVKIAPDERNFNPIWAALEATGLPLLHRQSFCARVWTPQRLIAYLGATGVLDRFPQVRLGFLDTRSAPSLRQLLERASTARGDAEPRRNGSRVERGRVFAAGAPGSAAQWSAARDREAASDALLWQSDFPLDGPLEKSLNSIEEVWGVQRRPLLEDNPGRFLNRA